ncbi:MAG: hypothetical protein RIR16_281 [Actinomycetota bacterium]|jgi:tight adherence protein C
MLEASLAVAALGGGLIIWRLSERKPSRLMRLLGSNQNSQRSKPTRAKTSAIRSSISQAAELADFLWLTSMVLRSGQNLFAALNYVTQRADGLLAYELRKIVNNLSLGAPFEQEFVELAKRLPDSQISEFSTTTVLSLRRGSSLAAAYGQLSQSIRAEVSAEQVRRAAKNESKMLIPLVFMILPITVAFAVFPSISLMRGIF